MESGERFLRLALYQGAGAGAKRAKVRAPTQDMLDRMAAMRDPTLVSVTKGKLLLISGLTGTLYSKDNPPPSPGRFVLQDSAS